MKDLGEAKKILGMEIKRDRHSKKLYLSQKEYLKRVLKRFGMNKKTKSVSTPFAPHLSLVMLCHLIMKLNDNICQ